MSDYLHDAEYKTASWRERHSPEAIKQMGVWRWKGIQKHASRILQLFTGKRVIDFGGADGPLGFGSRIIDAKLGHTSNDVADMDAIFTSHTLEHCPGVAMVLRGFVAKLPAGGYLIAHVPAWTCKRWQAGNYENQIQETKHLWTFKLDDDRIAANYLPLDSILCQLGLVIELAEHCGDDSILVIARKP